MKTPSLLVTALAPLLLVAGVFAAEAIPPIPRVLPPEGLEIPAEVRTRLEQRLGETKARFEAAARQFSPRQPEFANDRADIEVFLKAVELALVHREFYVERDFAKADWALDEANKRLDVWTPAEVRGIGATTFPWPWEKKGGLQVRGYRSSIDNSAQPYGLVIPENHDFDKPCPLYVWLHGRGDKNTDLHFLFERASRAGQITPAGAIVLHPFGRHCVGWKHAGEIDVFAAIQSVEQHFKIDRDRIVLIGFSMGGAGAWHIGAHYAQRWVAVSPGAGFADTARYQRLTPDRYPPWYEQKLWGLYDVPNYVRNLFNTEVIAYSGELDRQIQAARVMEEAFQAEGRTLTHLIGPGVEHKYEPATLAELLKRLEAIVAKGREEFPPEAHLQTRTLKYPGQKWVWAQGLEEHWTEARIDAVRDDSKYEVTTKNVTRLSLLLPQDFRPTTDFVVDGQTLPRPEVGKGLQMPVPAGPVRGFITREGFTRLPDEQQPRDQPGRATLIKRDGKWEWLTPEHETSLGAKPIKRWLLQGPIDDVYTSEFIVVTPTGKSKNSRFQAWVDFEVAHFRDRWRALMRGEPPMKTDAEFTEADAYRHLVLWGDPDSNSVMARMLVKNNSNMVSFQDGKWTFGGQQFDGDRFIPAMIYPREVTRRIPARRGRPATEETRFRYTVLNSGLTFREAHDRTNSQQNPKLPDWAIIDISQPPDANAPGRIHDADFFDEQWQLKRPPKAPDEK